MRSRYEKGDIAHSRAHRPRAQLDFVDIVVRYIECPPSDEDRSIVGEGNKDHNRTDYSEARHANTVRLHHTWDGEQRLRDS
jgi:hypothetical protein